MSAADVLDAVRSRGGALLVAGDRVRYRGPQEGLDDHLRAQIAAHKSALLLELEAERAWATVEAISAEMRRRWRRAEQLAQSDDPEDRFVAEHHRDEVRGAVTACWLPAMKRWATLEHRLGRLDPELVWLVETGDEEGGQP